MAALTLLASALLAFGTAAGFTATSIVVARRHSKEGHALAPEALVTFWSCGAAIAVSGGLRSAAAFAGWDSFPLVEALEQPTTLLYCVGAAGLLYYVVFLQTGLAWVRWPILAYYAALVFVLRFFVARAHPIGYVVGEWQVNYVYQSPLQTPGYAVALMLMILPLLLGILAYGLVYFRIDDPGRRYRVGCITVGLALWITTEAAAWGTGLAATTAGELARRLVALGATLVILLAYAPPTFARASWDDAAKAH